MTEPVAPRGLEDTMDRSRTMHRIALTALLALSLPLGACTSEVACEGQQCDQMANDSSKTTSGSGPTAVAILNADMPSVDTGDGSSGTGGGTTPDPDALNVFIGDAAVTCGTPYGATDCNTHWNVSLLLPVDLQEPGTYDFAPDVDATHVLAYESTTAPTFSGDCTGSAGTTEGWVEVTSIDDLEVKGHLHAEPLDGSAPVDVDFVAPRCH